MFRGAQVLAPIYLVKHDAYPRISEAGLSDLSHVARNINRKKADGEETSAKSNHLEAANTGVGSLRLLRLPWTCAPPCRPSTAFSRILLKTADKWTKTKKRRFEVIRDKPRRWAGLSPTFWPFGAWDAKPYFLSDINMPDLITQVWRNCSCQPRSQEMSLKMDNLPPTASGDSALIRQVLVNLIGQCRQIHPEEEKLR